MISNKAVFYNDTLRLADYITNKYSRVVSKKQNIKEITFDASIPTLGSDGAMYSVKIPKEGDQMITSIDIKAVLSTITTTGGTFRRYVDGVGMYHWIRLELWSDGELVNTIYAENLDESVQQHNNLDEYAVLQQKLGIATTAVRNAASAAPQTFFVPLDEVFAIFSQPFPRFLCNDLELRVYFRGPLSALVETDGTAPVCSLLDYKLVVSYDEVGNDIVNFLKEKANSRDGFIMYQYSYLQKVFPVAAGASTSQTIPLEILNNKDLIYCNIVSKLNSDLSTPLACNYRNYQLIQQFNMKSSSNYINGTQFDVTDVYYKRYFLQDYDFLGMAILATSNIYSISFSENLSQTFGERQNTYSGSKDFTGISDAEINLIVPSTTNALRIIVNMIIARRVAIRNGKLVILN